MSTVILMALPVVFLALSVWYARRAVKRGAKPSRAFLRQLASFAVVCLVVLAAPMIASAASTDAAGAANAVASAAPDLTAGLGMIAAALAVGIAGVGGGVAVAAAAPLLSAPPPRIPRLLVRPSSLWLWAKVLLCMAC